MTCILDPASTGDEQHRFPSDSWVPTETVIVSGDRAQRTFINFAQNSRGRRKDEVRCDASKPNTERQRQKEKIEPHAQSACRRH